MVDFRPLDPERDLPALADLINLTSTVPVTLDLLREWRANADPGRARQQIVAVDETDAPVAVGDCLRDPWMPFGQYWLDIVVQPAYRAQGIGAQLYAVSEAWALANGALYLGGDVRDGQPEGLRFALERGFKAVQRLVEHHLDLDSFDPAAHAPLIAGLQGDGYTFLSYAEAGDSRDHRKLIYKLNKRTVIDDPSFVGAHLPFVEYSKRIFESSWSRVEELMIAAQGDSWVGFTQLADFPQSGAVILVYTGVERAFRRHGLATALGALALAHAQARGVPKARVTVDGRDETAQAVAARLGFTADPGASRMVKPLQQRSLLRGKN